MSIISPKQTSTMYKTLTVCFVFSVYTKLMTLRLCSIIYQEHFLLSESVFKESSLVMTTKLNLKSNCIYNVSNTKPPTTNIDRVAAQSELPSPPVGRQCCTTTVRGRLGISHSCTGNPVIIVINVYPHILYLHKTCTRFTTYT